MTKRPLLKVFFAVLLIFALLCLTGCEDEEGYLNQYADGRLGVILEAPLSEPETAKLSTQLIDYIGRRTELEIVDPRHLTGAYNYEDERSVIITTNILV